MLGLQSKGLPKINYKFSINVSLLFFTSDSSRMGSSTT